MFRRSHHQRIATLLDALDADLFEERHCLFGGGSAIALTFGEFRESRDVDFLVSDIAGFRDLRALVARHGPSSLFSRTDTIVLPQRFSQDNYGIRGWVSVDEHPIKFEIVSEGRISLAKPGPRDYVGNIARLTRSNMVAEKLMANCDRYADSSTFHRDLIDLAFMGIGQVQKTAGFDIAHVAYGDAISRDLMRSASRLLDTPAWLTRCMNALAISAEPHSVAMRVRHLTGM